MSFRDRADSSKKHAPLVGFARLLLEVKSPVHAQSLYLSGMLVVCVNRSWLSWYLRVSLKPVMLNKPAALLRQFRRRLATFCSHLQGNGANIHGVRFLRVSFVSTVLRPSTFGFRLM